MNAQTQIWHEMSSILTIFTWYVNVAVHQLEFQVDNHFAQSINNVTVHTATIEEVSVVVLTDGNHFLLRRRQN